MDEQPRHVGIQEFVLWDVDERCSPAEQPVLRVRSAGDGQVCFCIEKYDEDSKTSTYTTVEDVVVDFEPLWNGLLAMRASEGYKPR